MIEFIIVTSSQSFPTRPTNDSLVKLFNILVQTFLYRKLLRKGSDESSHSEHSHISMLLNDLLHLRSFIGNHCVFTFYVTKAVPINITINQHLSISPGPPLTIFTIKYLSLSNLLSHHIF